MNGRAVSYTAREAKSLCPLTCPAALLTRSPFPSSGRRASPPPPLLLQELSPTQGLGDPVRAGIRTGPSPGFPPRSSTECRQPPSRAQASQSPPLPVRSLSHLGSPGPPHGPSLAPLPGLAFPQSLAWQPPCLQVTCPPN